MPATSWRAPTVAAMSRRIADRSSDQRGIVVPEHAGATAQALWRPLALARAEGAHSATSTRRPLSICPTVCGAPATCATSSPCLGAKMVTPTHHFGRIVPDPARKRRPAHGAAFGRELLSEPASARGAIDAAVGHAKSRGARAGRAEPASFRQSPISGAHCVRRTIFW